MNQQQAADDREIAKIWRGSVRKGDPCEVRDLRHSTRQTARIERCSRGGCDVRFEDNHLAFIHWGALFPPPIVHASEAAPAKKPTLVASLGEIVKQPAPSNPAKPRHPDPEPDPEPEATSMRTRKPHQTTAIGNIFRSERLKRMLDQEQMGTLIGCSYGTISKVELGDSSPSDELLLRFSEEFNVSIGMLEVARDGRDEYAADPVKGLRRIAELESELQTLRPYERRTASLTESLEALRLQLKDVGDQRDELRRALDETLAKLNARHVEYATLAEQEKSVLTFDGFMEVLEFTRAFAAIKPIPEDATKRIAWYRVAFAAHEEMQKL